MFEAVSGKHGYTQSDLRGRRALPSRLLSPRVVEILTPEVPLCAYGRGVFTVNRIWLMERVEGEFIGLLPGDITRNGETSTWM